jgi:signal transduction histidine kinase
MGAVEDPRRSSAAAAAVLGLAVVSSVAGLGLTLYLWSDMAAVDAYPTLLSVFSAIVYAALGVLIVRRARNPVGWALAWVGVGTVLVTDLSLYAMVAMRANGLSLPAPHIVGAMAQPVFAAMAISLAYIMFIFPTGHLASSRWTWVFRIGVAAAIATVVLTTVVPANEALPAPGGISLVYPNPLRIVAEPLSIAFVVCVWIVAAATLAAFLSLVARYRSGGLEERQQIKWLAFVAAAALVCNLAGAVSRVVCGCDRSIVSTAFFLAVAPLVLIGVPAAMAIAILRYRLYDIDVVISRTILYGSLAAVFTGIYVGVVIGVGALIGSRADPLLTIVAAVIIAVVFQPLRERTRRLANRLVYGERATPYQVMSDLVERMAETFALDDVLERTAIVVSQGVGAQRVQVWLRVGHALRLAADWPSGSAGRSSIALSEGDTLPPIDGATRVVPVRHADELLGALALTKPPGEPLTDTEDKLLQDLASQSGLVLRNASLTAELRSTIDELQASRRRLVEAGDKQRQKIERNLHDGAQQQLVALAVKLRLAHDLAVKDGAERTASVVEQARSDTNDALENLRDLARGIYPPVLADRGLPAAIEAQARKAALPVSVESDGVGRFEPEIEAAVYFCSLEALQNVAKYAGATRAMVRIETFDGTVRFAVEDDGAGFDPASTPRGSGLQGMLDRLEAVGGSLIVDSAPGHGTTVRGAVPID